MTTEILIALITGSISLVGVIITAWLNYKAKLLEIQVKSDKPLPEKRRKNTIWFIIFGVILLGTVYFLFPENITFNDDIVWETDTTGYFIDQRDQHKYKVVKIGKQIWMAQNLAYLPTVCPANEECGYWVYDYQGNNVTEAKATNNYQTYGVLYNWETAVKVAPKGWHLPSDNEWKQLEVYLGMTENEANISGWRGNGIGTKIKSIIGWDENSNGNNNSGFNSLPGGYNSGSFVNVGKCGFWWSCTNYNEKKAWGRYIIYSGNDICHYWYDCSSGYNVRCLKNQKE